MASVFQRPYRQDHSTKETAFFKTQKTNLVCFYNSTGDIKARDFFFSLTILFCLFSASLSGSNAETVYIFSHEATAEFISDYSENYNGFNATYTAFNANELNSKCSFLFACFLECLVKLYFQFDKMEMNREAVFSGLSLLICSTLRNFILF